MKRVLLAVALLIVAVVAGRAIYIASASDETRIRWVLQEEAEDFNNAAVLGILSGFASDYRDLTTGLDRPSLRGALVFVYQNRRDPREGRFLYRVELPEDALQIDVDGDRAVATFPLRLYEGLDEAATLTWEVEITADLELRQGEWVIVQSRHETLQGERPGR